MMLCYFKTCLKKNVNIVSAYWAIFRAFSELTSLLQTLVTQCLFFSFFFVVLVNKLALVPLSRKEGERGSLVQVGRLRLVSSCSATQPRWPHRMTVSEVWHMVLHISLLHVYFNAYMHNHLCEKYGKKCIFESYWKATPTAGWQSSSVQWKEQQTCCAAYNCMCVHHILFVILSP